MKLMRVIPCVDKKKPFRKERVGEMYHHQLIFQRLLLQELAPCHSNSWLPWLRRACPSATLDKSPLHLTGTDVSLSTGKLRKSTDYTDQYSCSSVQSKARFLILVGARSTCD